MESDLPEIKGFLECSLSDWDGHVVAVIWLPGCNFRCSYCFNHDLVLHPEKVKTIPWGKVEERLKALDGWISGVCITGGEPTRHAGLPALVKKIKGLGLNVKLDTNGSNAGVLKKLLPDLDYIAMDIKAPLEKYDEVCRVKVDIKEIKKSIKLIIGSGIDHEFRTTVLPEHPPDDLKRMAGLVKGCKLYVLQQFDPTTTLLQKRYMDMERTAKLELERLAAELSRIVPTKCRAQ